MKKLLTKYLPLILALLCSSALVAQQPLTLQQCRELALQHNEDLKHADNALLQAEMDKQIAFASYLPQLDGSLMGVYGKDIDLMGMSTIQMHGMWMAGLTLTQPLYVGGQITTGNKLAAVGLKAKQELLRKTRAEVIKEVDNGYWTLIAVQEKVKMLQAFERQMNALYDQVQLSVDAEMATENDLLRIATKQSEIKYQLQKAQNGVELCRMALCSTLGLDLTDQLQLVDTEITAQAPLNLDEDISARPEVALLQQQLEVSKYQVKMAKSGYLPTVALQLGYNHLDNMKIKGFAQDAEGNYQPYTRNHYNNSTTAMLSVQVPLFHWGSEVKKVKKARLDVRNAELDLQKNTRLLGIEARQAVQNLTSGYQMIETSRLGRDQADQNLANMQLKYDNEMCTLTDLLDAESQWQQARSNEIEALTQYKIYETEYLRVTGRLD